MFQGLRNPLWRSLASLRGMFGLYQSIKLIRKTHSSIHLEEKETSKIWGKRARWKTSNFRKENGKRWNIEEVFTKANDIQKSPPFLIHKNPYMGISLQLFSALFLSCSKPTNMDQIADPLKRIAFFLSRRDFVGPDYFWTDVSRDCFREDPRKMPVRHGSKTKAIWKIKILTSQQKFSQCWRDFYIIITAKLCILRKVTFPISLQFIFCSFVFSLTIK